MHGKPKSQNIEVLRGKNRNTHTVLHGCGVTTVTSCLRTDFCITEYKNTRV